MNQSYIIAEVKDYVKSHHAHDYSGHDFEHVKRVVHLAHKILAHEPQADAFIVELAAWLHDVDDYKLGNGDTNNAQKLLQKLVVPDDVIGQIITAVDSIGFSKTGYNPQLPTLEAKILYDADKLDAIGASGIARTLAYGGNKCRPLFLPEILPPETLDLDAYRQNAISGNNHSIIHFFEKLLRLSALMQTKTGQQLAQQRQKLMIIYLENFFIEQDLTDWLELLHNNFGKSSGGD